ncbi:hypothetical protein ACFY0N_34945 [Streptomyces vinaceus]
MSRPKKVRSALSDTAARDSEAKASGLMVRIRAMEIDRLSKSG